MLELEQTARSIRAESFRPAEALAAEELHGQRLRVEAAPALEALLQKVVPVDQDCKLVWHALRSGEEIRSHLHPHATEWTIFRNGSFDLLYGNEVQRFEGAGQDWQALRLAAAVRHALVSRSTFQYFVIRDRDDETWYEDEPLASAPLQSLDMLSPTFRVVVGNETCNAACPFCRRTPEMVRPNPGSRCTR